MAYDGDDFGVDQLLCNRGTDFRIGLIILAHEVDLQHFAVDLDLFGIGLINGQSHPIFIVFAQMRDRARQRTRMGDFHRNGRLSGDFNFRRGLGFFFAATDDTGGQQGSEQNLVGHFHQRCSKLRLNNRNGQEEKRNYANGFCPLSNILRDIQAPQ